MRPVAEWLSGTDLAAAPGNLPFFGNFHKQRPHARRPVGTVTKRLLLGKAAAAPDITARFDIHDKRMVVFAHQFKVLAGLDETTLIAWPKVSICPTNKQLAIALS